MTTTPHLSTPEASREALVARLAAMPVFAALASATVLAVAEMAVSCHFGIGEILLSEGHASSSFFVVLGGRVKMCRALANGRTAVVALFGRGEIFGAAAALGGRECDASFVALEKSACLEIRRDDLFERFEQEPALISDLLPILTRQFVECSNCILELSCFRLEVRFAQLFLKLADDMGENGAGGKGVGRTGDVFIPVSLTRQELADMTGTTVESCIRIMSRWGKSGLVDTEKRGFRLRDRAALETLAHESG